MVKVRERGAPLPGNDKENWGNHHIDVTGIWRGRGKEWGRRKQRERIFQRKEKEEKRENKERSRNWGRVKANERVMMNNVKKVRRKLKSKKNITGSEMQGREEE